MAMNDTRQAMQNMEYARRLLEQKQPGFAASLAVAVSLICSAMNRSGLRCVVGDRRQHRPRRACGRSRRPRAP